MPAELASSFWTKIQNVDTISLRRAAHNRTEWIDLETAGFLPE